MRAILVGAGGIGRAVLERLGDHWEVTVLDLDADRLAALQDGRPVTTLLGDGSSRLTLERAGLSTADAVVIALRDDGVALEVSRLAVAARVPRVIAMVVTSSRQGEFTRLGASAIAPDRLAARHVEMLLEPRRQASAAFADGRAEAIEFRLAPDSPLVGRALAEIGLHGWLVAAVLRDDGDLIVPHGGTVLTAGDRVTVVGAATDHALMVRTFTGGEARFPLPYGRRVAVLLPESDSDAVLREAMAFVRLTAAGALLVVHPRLGALDREAAAALRERIDGLASDGPNLEFVEGAGERVRADDLLALRGPQNIGCFVLPRARGVRAALRALGVAGAANVPVLLASGLARYEGLAIPARDSAGGWDAAWAALDLAAHNRLALEAVGASTPQFLVSEDDEPSVRAAVTRLRDEGSIRGVEVTGRIVRDNPVRLFGSLPAGILLVLGLGRDPGSLLRPGFTAAVAGRLPGSLLAVPPGTQR
jgi:Trk K+ transport system NAD-binding subunit